MTHASARRRRTAATAVGAALVGLGLSACSSGAHTSASKEVPSTTSAPYSTSHPYPDFPKFTKKVHLTWWTWTTNPKRVIAAFEKRYPNISVTAYNPGSGTPTFTKLKAALQAGNGAPDVSQLQWPQLPEFIATKKLLNLAPYVDQYKSYFPSFAWADVSNGSAVYGVPEDWGTLGFAYRPDVFKKYGLKVPVTQEQYASDAAKLHSENHSMYMGEFPINGASFLMDLFWQAGVNIYQQLGPTKWRIDLDQPKTQAIMKYWGKLIDAHEVLPVASYTAPDSQRISNGVYASYYEPAWGPTYQLDPNIKAGAQTFKLTSLPEVVPGKKTDSSDVASINVVPDQTKYPGAAALFASYINLAKPELEIGELPGNAGGRGLFPSAKARGSVPQFSRPAALFGNKPINPIFDQLTGEIKTEFRWSPWTGFVDTTAGTELSKAAAGKEPFSDVLPHIQRALVTFAKGQGYTVSQ